MSRVAKAAKQRDLDALNGLPDKINRMNDD
jgi:hypothetical protein